MINLSRVIHSPMFSQKFQVIRSGGRWENGFFVREFPDTLTVSGIITIAKPEDLELVPEGDRQSGTLRVLTTEKLYQTGEEETGFSDVIVWRGEKYRLISVTPDIDYGFFRSLAVRLRGGEI